MFRPYLLILSLCLLLQLNAQKKLDYVFNHLEPSNGFPAKMVRKIVKDKSGLMWMLTDKGLMKYNGHSAKFYPAKKDSSGLLNVPFYSLYIDKEGIIWIGYLEVCLSSFDPKTEKFTHYFYNEKDKTSYPPGGAVHFMEDKRGDLWIAVWGGGLCKFNREKKNFKTFSSTKEEAAADSTRISTHNCTYVVEMNDGKFMVGTWEGEGFKNSFLQYFDPKTEKFSRFNFEKYTFSSDAEKGALRSAFRIVHFIYPAPDNKIWVGSFIGLVCIDNNNMTIKRYSGVGGTMAGSGKYENAMDYMIDNTGKYWIATEVTGIMVIDPITKKCAYLNHQYRNAASISGDNIFSMYKDDDDNIWICTSGGKIDVYTPLLQQFKFIDNDELKAERENRAQGQTAVHHLELSQNSSEVYMSSGNGVTVYDPDTDSIRRIDTKEILFKNKAKLGMKESEFNHSWNNVIETHEYGNKLLICNPNGLIVYDKIKKTYDFPGFKDYSMISIGRNKHRFVFVGRTKYPDKEWNARLVKMDTNFKIIKEMKFPEWPFSDLRGVLYGNYIVPLGEHNWYINFNHRLFYIYNDQTDEFKPYCARKECNTNFPDSALVPLVKDKDDDLWIAGNNGLYKFDYRTGKAEKLNDIFNIGKEQIFSITIDSLGIFWVALKQDLLRYDPKTSESFRFNNKLGLNVGGFSKVPTNINFKNRIFILSSYGLLHFDPCKLNFTKQKPDIFIAELVINKDTLNEDEKSVFLNSDHTLAYDQNHITFEYGTYQIYTPGPKQYEYRLLGLDSTWYNNHNRNYISYPALVHGSYTLEIKCKNIYEVNSDVFSFKFLIEPPVWKRWWFIIGEAILAVLLITLIIKRREKILLADKLKLENTVTERTREVVEKAKEIEMQNEIIFEKNKELTDSIKYAERIQKALLAHSEFMSEYLPPHFVLFKPKAIVSGDFYWATCVAVTELKKDLFYLMVGDCTGHGVPGAFMSLLNISFLNEAITEKHILEPDKILNDVRERLMISLASEKGQDGMDGTLVCYDKKKNMITYASAHNKPILIRDGAMKELSADKMPIGKGEREDSFTLQAVQLQKGDMIYFYTDGYADQFGGDKGKKFKYRQLNELLVSISNKSPEKQQTILDETFETWRGNLEQVDDVLVIGIKI
ncbi:MAG TPA: SpoIIE family protein phosphatase [Bacteroidia bacterium]|jgi:serine phosphatase RsbU (regulator of sigma subunit)/ligand-binding sensor domain-containing protein|nr:SpoIIE family protein phosphatase [Bacteroidia bacterium]